MKEKTLSLVNNGQLSVFFVGVGSAFSKKHYQTNALIIKGKNHIMVDCGTKCPQALYELGLSVADIDNYLITHSHADHIGGLEEVMLMGRYFRKKRPNIIISDTYQHLLWDLSLRGGAAFNEEENGRYLAFGDLFNIIRPDWLESYPRETLECNLGDLNIKMFRTMHIPDNPTSWHNSFWSCGLVLDNKVLYTSDTRFDRELIESFNGIFDLEYIFHDCQFFTGGVHAGIEELNTLPAEIKKKMVLMHYGDNWQDFQKKVKSYGFHSLARQWNFYDF
ncbi:MAG: MBL fold metallo-hydrolase [Spirochaetales bacterium]|nr:MBL fold metallo-hydrolase [Spirochaetales bacterium]